MLVAPFDVLAAARPAVTQVAHHFRVGVEFHLVLEVFLRQRDQPETTGAERRLAHGCILRLVCTRAFDFELPVGAGREAGG